MIAIVPGDAYNRLGRSIPSRKGTIVAIDIRSETVITFEMAATSLPCPDGKRVSPRSVRRWTYVGLRGVILESVKVGGRRFTTEEAVHRFLSRLNETAVPDPVPSSPVPTVADRKERERVARELARRGY